MPIDTMGFSSITELLENNFYKNNKEYHALKDAKTELDMNMIQNQVRQMARERKKVQ